MKYRVIKASDRTRIKFIETDRLFALDAEHPRVHKGRIANGAVEKEMLEIAARREEIAPEYERSREQWRLSEARGSRSGTRLTSLLTQMRSWLGSLSSKARRSHDE